MVFVMLVFTLVLLGVIFLRPKWGTFLIWPVLFTYPHSWWYYHQFLPWNIGVDDLLCITLFFLVLIRRNILGGLPVRLGYSFWIITSFVVIAIVANAVGSRDATPDTRYLYIKDILKLILYWGLFYSIIHSIDDEKDLRLQLVMFSAAAIVGGLLVILQYFYPYQMRHWTSPLTLEKVGIRLDDRASGAFLNSNGAACVLTCSLVLVVTAMRLVRRLTPKILLYGFIFLLLIAVLVTKSRAGLLALGVTFVLMAFSGRSKRVAWLVIAAGAMVALCFPHIRGAYVERILGTYTEMGHWGDNVTGRFYTWQSYFTTATAKEYLLGQGFRQGNVRNGMESHSAYVSLITVYGISGLVWGIVALILFLRKALAARNSPDPLISMVGAGCIWAFLAWAVYALTSDAISSQYPRYILFYLVVLVDRASAIARDRQGELGMHYEIADQQQMHYPAAGVP